MGKFLNNCWIAVMDSSHNPLRNLDLASQHYFMQVLGWMWSMISSLMFFSIFHFGLTWVAHVLVFGGIAMTVALFREAELKQAQALPVREGFSHASKCVWKLDSEA